MLTPPREVYPNNGSDELAILDLRCLGFPERLHGERAAWQEQSDTEVVPEYHFAVIVSPGSARRVVR